jgi:hypothetical protein
LSHRLIPVIVGGKHTGDERHKQENNEYREMMFYLFLIGIHHMQNQKSDDDYCPEHTDSLLLGRT